MCIPAPLDPATLQTLASFHDLRGSYFLPPCAKPQYSHTPVWGAHWSAPFLPLPPPLDEPDCGTYTWEWGPFFHPMCTPTSLDLATLQT